jgi:hypothetical protein
MPVLASDTARADVLILRGAATEWGVLWETSPDGAVYTPVDLTKWIGTLTLRSPLGEVWLRHPVTTSIDGLVAVQLTPDLFGASEWGARTGGRWEINLTSPAGRIERLSEGYFYLEQ